MIKAIIRKKNELLFKITVIKNFKKRAAESKLNVFLVANALFNYAKKEGLLDKMNRLKRIE